MCLRLLSPTMMLVSGLSPRPLRAFRRQLDPCSGTQIMVADRHSSPGFRVSLKKRKERKEKNYDYARLHRASARPGCRDLFKKKDFATDLFWK